MAAPSKEQSLANLQVFIARQEAHLAQTRADMVKIEQLRDRAREDPERFAQNLSAELDDPAFRRPPPEYLQMPAIDWNLVSGSDPRIFDNIRPARLHHVITVEDSSIRSQVDEFVQAAGFPPLERTRKHIPPEPYVPPELVYLERQTKRRRVKRESTVEMEAQSVPDTSRDETVEREEDAEGSGADDRIPSNGTSTGLSTSQLPLSTFKVPWTTTEQRLLEKHLALIPPTEPHRWAKISRAMKEDGADRAPRQVGSRVQKMFAKMKQMGVEAQGGLSSGDVGDGGVKRRKKEEKEAEERRESEKDKKMESTAKAKWKPKPKQKPK